MSPRLAVLSLLASIATAHSAVISSPGGNLAIEFSLTQAGEPQYTISLDGEPVLAESKLGLIRDDEDFSKGLKLTGESDVERVEDQYEILTAKRRANTYVANRQVFHLETEKAAKMDVIFQVSDDGVAFRYAFPDTSPDVRRIEEEVTAFHFLPETRAWMQPMSEAKSGWAKTNPSYEEYYQMEIPVGTASPTGAGWVYPALFRSDSMWILVSESALSRNYCGTRLISEAGSDELRVGFPDERENFEGGSVKPKSTLPWMTPWRVIVVGDLATIVESTLGIDVADPPAVEIAGPIQPGRASWSWVLGGDGSVNFERQREFVDYAARMGWEYCLVDALWDTQIGDAKMKELCDYAKSKGVGIIVWENSAGDWNDTYQTPKSKLLTHDSRIAEFKRLKKMGVAGMKIDFFGGDGQSMIAYYHDILEDAAPFGFMINFHGATLPRGLQRTYPHLMTVEAIRGQEFITFEQANADRQPSHASMLPFARNVFAPMDFTPVALEGMKNTQRRTTDGFELAESVLFTSGIQHFADSPEGMAAQPKPVQEFLANIPAVWDDTKFLAGFPGKYVVLARRAGKKLYVAGINGQDEPQNLSLDLAFPGLKSGQLIKDGDESGLEAVPVKPGKLEIELKPHGGFVAVFE